MKVQMTLENQAYYNRLFNEMTSYCAELTDNMKENLGLTQLPSEISDLATYYKWLNQMRGIDNYDLFRVPVEEEEGYFEIDLNSRAITVPSVLKEGNVVIRSSSFKENGIGVQGDQAAEIIYFRCARFFDDMDLSLCQENPSNPEGIQGACWIQWKHSEDTTAHVSLAYNFDVDPQNIIFGWVLGDEITERSGDIEFSVRFVQWDPTDLANVAQDDPHNLSYSLSTLSAKCKIHSSLSALYDLADYKVEKNLNSVVAKRKIYSGIYQTAFGAYPVILSTGDLPLSADLRDYVDEAAGTTEKGVYHYYITAYSPDNGDLAATWFQDIYGDTEQHVVVQDDSRVTVSEPDANGNVVFGFTADAAGSYYAVISNTNKTNGTIRTTTSNGSIIDHASNFTLDEAILPKAYCVDGTVFRVTPIGANGIAEGVAQNEYNGVSYQWYIRKTTGEAGKYHEREVIAGATSAEFIPYNAEAATQLDGIIDCEVTNKRNKDTLMVKSNSTCELRAEPTAPVFTIALDGNKNVAADLSNEPDKRDLYYNWMCFEAPHLSSNDAVYAPWKIANSGLKSGQTITVSCKLTRKIWAGTNLEREAYDTKIAEIIVP